MLSGCTHWEKVALYYLLSIRTNSNKQQDCENYKRRGCRHATGMKGLYWIIYFLPYKRQSYWTTILSLSFNHVWPLVLVYTHLGVHVQWVLSAEHLKREAKLTSSVYPPLSYSFNSSEWMMCHVVIQYNLNLLQHHHNEKWPFRDFPLLKCIIWVWCLGQSLVGDLCSSQETCHWVSGPVKHVVLL